jgi:hypothetical protein
MALSWNFSYEGESGNVTKSGRTWLFSYPCSNSSLCSSYKVTLTRGVYFFELWGAQGGNSSHSSYQTYPGAVGGYTAAAESFNNDVELELYVGGMGGLNSDFNGGFNGGGRGSGLTYGNKGAGGGGATDVRIINGGSSAKILVAGGGGGSSTFQQTIYGQIVTSGVGGGLEGGNGAICLGGAQTPRADSNCYLGLIGQGANGINQAAGGGGGYYGGNGGKNKGQNGGGSSGYIDSSGTIHGIVPVTLSGTNSFPVPSLSSSVNETGHQGNGAIRITFIAPARTSIPNYIKELCKILNTKGDSSRIRDGWVALLSLTLFIIK